MYPPCHSTKKARTGNFRYRVERVTDRFAPRKWFGERESRLLVILQYEWRYELTGGAPMVDRDGGTRWADATPEDLMNDSHIPQPTLVRAGAA